MTPEGLVEEVRLLDIETEEPIHVVPEFGPRHCTKTRCWCYPACLNTMEVLNGDHTALIFLHNVFH